MLRELPKPQVLVVGDVMLDRYLVGKVQRISPESPVPIVSLEREYASPGGAGHVAASLAALGCTAVVAGIIGTDPAGVQLREGLERAGVHDHHLIERPTLRTICKTRVLAGGRQQLLRLDEDGRPE